MIFTLHVWAYKDEKNSKEVLQMSIFQLLY